MLSKFWSNLEGKAESIVMEGKRNLVGKKKKKKKKPLNRHRCRNKAIRGLEANLIIWSEVPATLTITISLTIW